MLYRQSITELRYLNRTLRSDPDDGRHMGSRWLRPAGVVLDDPLDALANDRRIIDSGVFRSLTVR